jgi:hypothetical protein
MRTNVKATNWPTRADAAHNMPRESRRGENVASRRTYEDRRKAAAARDMDKLLARATRHFAQAHAIAANAAREHELTVHTDHVVAARDAAALDYARRNA